MIRQNRSRLLVGSPTTVRERLAALIEATGADELMITSMIYEHELRKRSYELLARAFGVQPPGSA
jgi:alkanesulfonate monooxygenase SsuD/methylene tetrahydromethanopterin reductase-like flavin-dependent oxidoreductase (luciferase family)